MDTLRIAICEDDPQEQESLLTLLRNSDYHTDATVFSNGEIFLTQFQADQYDLILMDIFMEQLTGIQVITQVRTVDSQVLVAFITSSQAFALESYRLDALKYIEKPASQKSVNDILQMAQMKQQAVNKLSLRIGNTDTTYPLSRILYLEQKGRTLLIYLVGGGVVSVNRKLGDVEAQLVGRDFLRCHKSYLVNLAFVRGIDRELCTFEMAGGSKVYIRRRSFWEMQKTFEGYLFSAKQEVPHG